MSAIYVGDLHGRLKHFRALDIMARQTGVEIILQVGDFGVLFGPGCEVQVWFKSRTPGPTWITCGGNHDNWPLWRSCPQVQMEGLVQGTLHQLAPGCLFAERNTVMDIFGTRHLFFGGAESIDKHLRRVGVEWWPEETPSYMEFSYFMAALEEHTPDVVVSHDAPESVPVTKGPRKSFPTPRNLGNVTRLTSHMPKRWYFGHHHRNQSWTIGDTEFICTGVHGGFSK